MGSRKSHFNHGLHEEKANWSVLRLAIPLWTVRRVDSAMTHGRRVYIQSPKSSFVEGDGPYGVPLARMDRDDHLP